VAFVTPKTWSFGEVLTSTDMNTYVRDNTADLDARVAAIPTVEGIGPNVVQTFIQTPFSTTSGSFVDVTNYEVTITPTTNTSKVLVIYTMMISHSDTGQGGEIRVRRDGIDVGLTNNCRRQLNTDNMWQFAGMLLDDPQTTSPVTYKVQALRNTSGTFYIGERATGANNTSYQITAIEVKA